MTRTTELEPPDTILSREALAPLAALLLLNHGLRTEGKPRDPIHIAVDLGLLTIPEEARHHLGLPDFLSTGV